MITKCFTIILLQLLCYASESPEYNSSDMDMEDMPPPRFRLSDIEDQPLVNSSHWATFDISILGHIVNTTPPVSLSLSESTGMVFLGVYNRTPSDAAYDSLEDYYEHIGPGGSIFTRISEPSRRYRDYDRVDFMSDAEFGYVNVFNISKSP